MKQSEALEIIRQERGEAMEEGWSAKEFAKALKISRAYASIKIRDGLDVGRFEHFGWRREIDACGKHTKVPVYRVRNAAQEAKNSRKKARA